MVTGLAFALVALSLPLPGFFTYSIALMGVIALSGATHDIAADGVYMTELDNQQQAKFIGWQGAFYNLAKVLTNGGLVFLAGDLKDHFGPVKASDDYHADLCRIDDTGFFLSHAYYSVSCQKARVK